MNKVLVALGVAGALLVAAIFLRGNVELKDGAAAGAAADTAMHAKYGGVRLSPDAVLAIAPGGSGKDRRMVNDAKVTPLMREMIHTRAYKAIYERLSKSTSRTPEEAWSLATILERCATISEDKAEKFPRLSMGGEQSREKFIASMSDKDPNRALRMAAFEQINSDWCEGLTGLEVSRKDIRAMYESAAAAGDPKARAELVRMALEEQRRDENGKWRRDGKMPSITEEQVATLKDVFASQDPLAILNASRVLMQSMQNLSLRTGAGELPLDFGAFNGAAMLTACSYGYECGTDSRPLQSACAIQGRCAASDYREYLYYYGNSPAASQLLGEYEAALQRAVHDRDWSYFTFHPGPSSGMAAYTPR